MNRGPLTESKKSNSFWQVLLTVQKETEISHLIIIHIFRFTNMHRCFHTLKVLLTWPFFRRSSIIVMVYYPWTGRHISSGQLNKSTLFVRTKYLRYFSMWTMLIELPQNDVTTILRHNAVYSTLLWQSGYNY